MSVPIGKIDQMVLHSRLRPQSLFLKIKGGDENVKKNVDRDVCDASSL
jgi:hypothetical protein